VNSSMESALGLLFGTRSRQPAMLTGVEQVAIFHRDLFESWSYSLPCRPSVPVTIGTSGAMGTSWKPHAGFTSWRTAHVNRIRLARRLAATLVLGVAFSMSATAFGGALAGKPGSKSPPAQPEPSSKEQSRLYAENTDQATCCAPSTEPAGRHGCVEQTPIPLGRLGRWTLRARLPAKRTAECSCAHADATRAPVSPPNAARDEFGLT